MYKQATELGILVKKGDGTTDYEGWCWSGSSGWVDYFNPRSWDWWKSLFKTEQHGDQWSWLESTVNTGIWNDMNEVCVSTASASPTLMRVLACYFQRPGHQYAA